MSFPDALSGAELAVVLNAQLGAEYPHRFTTSPQRPARGPVSLTDDRSRAGVLTGNDAYVLTFVRDNWGWAHGATQDRHQLAEAARAWLAGTGLEEMAARWPFVEFSELQLAYERGDALETQWRIIRRDATEYYRDVVELAAENPTVRRFFPGLGHNFLFMPHPFTHDMLASVAFQRPGRFRLRAPGHPEPLAEGPPSTVITKLAELLENLED
ncbi:hypothetical protein OG496_20430 [Streptomyces sp. NBC_00988]|uniref:hypothetical protein n=1 Tax=Streptomyces sp. NBC_00988 TaxID=2903704 RepID=UPI00386691A4|nr:hypothetical protein OG496_20430 [Streptomyces sp. NBC_00988]